jgi:WS/DGAT/MGAT family acyltransferase
VPLGLDRPYWVDDENFDLEYHVRHIALPKPGDWRQFCIQVSRIHARALDLDRPLWEAYVIEGLDSFLDLHPGSFALMIKTHLAAVDLRQLASLTTLLYDTSATPSDDGPPEPWFAESSPGRLSLLAHGMVKSATAPLRLARPLLRVVTNVAPAAVALASEMLLHPQNLPPTRFNSVVSPHRVFETRRFTEAEFEDIRALVDGASVEEAVLAVCGGALRRYLEAQGELPAGHGLGAIVYQSAPEATAPSSLVTAGDAAAALAWRHVMLGTDIADASQRLAAIHAQSAVPPDSVARVLGSRALAEAGEQASATLLSWSRKLVGLAGARLGARTPPAHCNVAFLPAPQQVQYLCGAKLTYDSAILPISDGLGLSFAVTRYDGRVVISPTSCRELIPDPEAFAQCLRDSFQEYLALAQAPKLPKQAPVRRRAAVKTTVAAMVDSPAEPLAAKRSRSGARVPSQRMAAPS